MQAFNVSRIYLPPDEDIVPDYRVRFYCSLIFFSQKSFVHLYNVIYISFTSMILRDTALADSSGSAFPFVKIVVRHAHVRSRGTSEVH